MSETDVSLSSAGLTAGAVVVEGGWVSDSLSDMSSVFSEDRVFMLDMGLEDECLGANPLFR